MKCLKNSNFALGIMRFNVGGDDDFESFVGGTVDFRCDPFGDVGAGVVGSYLNARLDAV